MDLIDHFSSIIFLAFLLDIQKGLLLMLELSQVSMASNSTYFQDAQKLGEVFKNALKRAFLKTENLVVLAFGLENVSKLVTDLENEARITKVGSSIKLQYGLVIVFGEHIDLTLLHKVDSLGHNVKTED
jgi:hypothetical protein